MDDMNIVDSKGLCEILNVKHRTLRDFWRDLPHFFIGRGRDLRSARFDINDVLHHLKNRDYNECLVRQNQETLDLQILEGQAGIPPRRVQNEKRGDQGRARKKKRTGQLEDPFRLLS